MHTGDGEIPARREESESVVEEEELAGRRQLPGGWVFAGAGETGESWARARDGRLIDGGAQIKVNKLRLLAADDWEEWKRTGEL
jgi:hypothetical protein